MSQHTKQRWDEVGERFASWGRRLSDHYEEAGSGESAEDAQRKLKEAARQIGNELDRAFTALDATVRDQRSKEDLKGAVGAIGSAVSATIEEAAVGIRRRGGSDEKLETPQRPDEADPPTPTYLGG